MTKSSVINRRAHAAYHEAGHAVAAWEQGIEIRSLAIPPDGDRGSDAQMRHESELVGDFEWNTTAKNRIKMESLVFVTLAGPMAEKLAAHDNYDSVHAQNDREHAIELAAYFMSPDITEKYLAYIDAWLEDFFAKPLQWAAVEELAGNLLAKQRRSNEEITKDILIGYQKHAELTRG